MIFKNIIRALFSRFKKKESEKIEDTKEPKLPLLPLEEQLSLVAKGMGMHPQVSLGAIQIARTALLLRYTGAEPEMVDKTDPEFMEYIFIYWAYLIDNGVYSNVLY